MTKLEELARNNWQSDPARSAEVKKQPRRAGGLWVVESAEVKFWRKVSKSEACWLWTASLDRHGYGRLGLAGKGVGAHRFSYELHNGPIPQGLTIDHLCRVRHCVNPAHLQAVTGKENTLRGISPCAKHSRRTHCFKGHPFDRVAIRDGKPTRYCSICRKDNNAAKARRISEERRQRREQLSQWRKGHERGER